MNIMTYTVTEVTKDVDGEFTKEELQNLKVIGGKNAGVCYQKDDYFGTSVSDPVKAAPRFNQVADTGHHSIADHTQVTVLLEGISKMLAIVLNSLGCYATSEKSGRYTVMTGNSDEERQLYEKWKSIFKNRILEVKPDIDDVMLLKKFEKKYPDSGYTVRGRRLLELEPKLDAKTDKEASTYFRETLLQDETLPSQKMAQENARYILSVFTHSTTMKYTTSLRQWNYIYDWCINFCNKYEPKADKEYIKVMAGGNGDVTIIRKSDGNVASYFEKSMYYDLLSLSNFIYETLYVEELRDFKHRRFDCMAMLYKDHPMNLYDLVNDKVDVTYQVSYPASFVQIAQAQRHRTLKYYMLFDIEANGDYDYFIPPVIRGTGYEQEWLNDLKSVECFVPQATMIKIVETGTLDNFILKCEERLCGRAQLEVMEQTRDTTNRFIKAVDSGECTNPVALAYINDLHTDNGQLKTKGMLLGSCRESCMWGCSSALDRPF